MNSYSTCSPHTHPLSHRSTAASQLDSGGRDSSINSSNNDENKTTTKNRVSGKSDSSRTHVTRSLPTNASNNFLLDNVSIHKDNFMPSPTSIPKDLPTNKPLNSKKSFNHNHLVTSDTRRSHQRSKTLNFEPKSISYLHQKRFSESENNPFLLSKNLENTTSNNTELNKRLLLLDLVNTGEISPAPTHNSLASNSPIKFNAGTSLSTITEDGASTTNSDAINNDSGLNTPPKNLIRKKTGEIVKSSLKLSSLANMGNFERSSQSLPTTPTYKSVHFNTKSFADVKYFNEKDTPEAISTEVTPLQSYKKMSSKKIASRNKKKSFNWLIGDSGSEDSDSDFSDDDVDAYNDDDDDAEVDNYSNYGNGTEQADWKLECLNFSDNGIYDFKIKENLPVFVERFFLTTDKKFFKGYIAVKNISFEKKVTFKYSLNNWRIISEIDAIYISDVPRILRKNNYDRFVIKIPISALVTDNTCNPSSGRKFTFSTSKEKVSLVAVIRYTAAGRDYWDNNYSKNYEMIFRNENYQVSHNEDNDDEDEYYFLKKNDHGFARTNKKKIKNAGLANNFNFSDDDTVSDYTLTFNDKHEEYFPTINTLSPIGINFRNNGETSDNPEGSTNISAVGDTALDNRENKVTSLVDTKKSNIDLTLAGYDDKAPSIPLKNPYQKYNKFELGESLLETPEIKSPTSLFYSAGVNAASTAESLVFGGKPSLPNNDNVSSSITSGMAGTNKNLYSPVSPARLLNMEKDSLIDKTKPILSPERALKLSEETKKNLKNDRFNLTNEIEKLRQSQHSTDSSDYQKLVQSYCFFQG